MTGKFSAIRARSNSRKVFGLHAVVRLTSIFSSKRLESEGKTLQLGSAFKTSAAPARLLLISVSRELRHC
jgi:hypothetical protein